MKKFEKNVADSFRLAKGDIKQLKDGFNQLSQQQDRMNQMLEQLRAHEMHLYKKLQQYDNQNPLDRCKEFVKEMRKRLDNEVIATKEGKTFHVKGCPFSENIKPKNKIRFSSEEEALKQGFSPCICAK